MGTEAKRHHIVPRFYLDRFADKKQVMTVELPGDRRFRQPITRAAAANGYYRLEGSHPAGPMGFEHALGRVEGAAATVLRKVLDDGVWPLLPPDRSALAEFLAVQFLRGANTRRLIAELVRATVANDLPVDDPDPHRSIGSGWFGRAVTPSEEERLILSFKNSNRPFAELPPQGHLVNLRDLLPEVRPFLIERPWGLMRFERRSLITSDTPVSLIHPTYVGGARTGLRNAGMILVPLSRRVALILGPPQAYQDAGQIAELSLGRYDTSFPSSATWNRYFNVVTASRARRWIYHHPDDGAAVPSPLPTPRERELSIEVTEGAPPGPPSQ